MRRLSNLICLDGYLRKLVGLLLLTTVISIGHFWWSDVAYAVGPYVVNSTGDQSDFNPGDGDCNIDTSGICTLRAAIEEANASPYYEAPISIHFNIPGAGPHIITPASPLPFLTAPNPGGDSIIIDGSTQPGASCAAWPPTLQIVLDGTNAGTGAISGLLTFDGGITVRGLVIHSFANENIGLYGPNNTIQCNFFGTNAAGTATQGSSFDHIFVNGTMNNLIGGDHANGGKFRDARRSWAFPARAPSETGLAPGSRVA